MTQRVLLHMTAPLREDFDISYHDIGDTTNPPRIALVAGLRGNELNGVFVLSRWRRSCRGSQTVNMQGCAYTSERSSSLRSTSSA